MKISVVISTYNGELYIKEQLDSLLTQDRKADEVLIFDDGSSDGTCDIVSGYIAANNLEDSWKLIKNEVNKGWRKNFKEGIKAASGDMVFPCDQDDIWRNDKLSVCEKAMEENSKIMLLTSNHVKFGENISEEAPAQDGQIIKHSFTENLFRINYPGCTFCVRKDFADKIYKYWDDIFPHDAAILRFANFADGFYSINSNLISWRKHSDSAFAKEEKSRDRLKVKFEWLEYANKMMSELDRFVEEEDVSSKEEKEKVILKNKKWLAAREKLFTSKNPLNGLKIVPYINCYTRRSLFLSDIKLVMKK